jgi:hypothetical protein
MMNSNEPTLVEDVNRLCIACAWEALLDFGGESLRTGQALLDIATKLLDKYPDAECGPAVVELADTLKGLHVDLTHIQRYEIYTDDSCSHGVTVH